MSDHDHDENGHGDDCCAHDGCCAHDHAHVDVSDMRVHDHSHSDAASTTGSMPVFDAVAFGGEPLTEDGGLFKKILTPGKASGGTPQPGDSVTVHYVGTLLDGTKFDSSRDRAGFFEFDVGLGRVIKGWDKGICTMHRGEKCVLACRADYAYGERGSPPKIPPNATLLFEVELFKWRTKRKERGSMDAAARIAEAESCKADGTAAFKVGDFMVALDKYMDAAYYCEDAEGGPNAEDVAALLLSCSLNAATCALKLEEYAQAVDHATAAIELDATSVKAFFRRGSAQMRLGNYAEAKADLRHASTLDPKSKEVRDLFSECVQKENAAKKSEKALYGKMFG